MANSKNMSGKDYAEKHARNLKAASEDIKKGVDDVDESPGKKAADQADAWQNAMSKQETVDKWKDRVGKLELSEWKRKMKEIGVGRISRGLDQNKADIEDFGDQLLSFINSAKPEFDKQKPRTIDEAAQKAADWIKKMGEFQRE